jgi:hypothetical protein
MPTKPSSEQLQQSISVICKVIGQIPCFHLYEENVAHRFSASESEIALKAMIHNAALESTLMSLRCFNEFFSSNRRDDDVRAGDFPGASMHAFLPSDDEKAIHKYLAHITVRRSDIVTKPWLIGRMMILGLQHGLTFLSTIETSFPSHTDEGRIEIRGVRDGARLLIPRIAKLHETKGAEK